MPELHPVVNTAIKMEKNGIYLRTLPKVFKKALNFGHMGTGKENNSYHVGVNDIR